MAKGETYEEFVKKFEKIYEKTTDDCYTPEEIWNIVVEYVEDKYGIDKKNIIRPFFPGGNYEDLTQYDEECYVVDNPPFSIMSKILNFYDKHNIKYFLFCEAKTFARSVKDNRCVILLREQIRYTNGAEVKTAFITNLENEYAIRPDYEINAKIKAINDTRKKPRREHEENCYSGAQFFALCYNNNRSYKHSELEYISSDKYGSLFGGGFRIK